MATKKTLALLVVALAAFGCEGKIGVNGADGIDQFAPDPTTDPDNPDGTEEPPPGTVMRPGDDPIDAEECKFISPGATPLRRLTGEEYHNSVRDIFDFATIPQQTFSPDERVSGFQANTISSVTELQAEEYQRAAEEISTAVVSSIDGVLAADADEAAVRGFITEYGQKAYRRPLTAEEVDGLYGLYDTGNTELDHETGVAMIVEAMLQSAQFVYRVEVGEDSEDPVVPLSDYEIASRLSYFLWGTTPDAELLNLAAAGELSTPDQVEVQARRLIADDRARDRVNTVFAEWLRIDELDGVDNPDPVFTDDVRNSMIDETRAFVDHVVWEGEGTVTELLTADYTFVDANTAALYGVQAGAEDGLVRVDLPPGRRGILSQPGVLTMHGHGQMPVHRGKFVRDVFLCLSDPAPAPPNEIEPLPTFEGESMRSKAEKRMEARDQGCAGCHSMMDGLGLAFDNFDSLGRYRTEDEFGNALTSNAEILYTKTTDAEVNGVAELADTLANSEEVNQCVTVQFFRYAFARLNGDNDACSLHVVNTAMAESGNDIKEMLVALATTDAFLYRQNLSADQ